MNAIWKDVLLIGGMALVTFGVRYPVLALVGRIPLPDRVFRALRYVPPAVLTAITVPAMLMPKGDLALAVDNAYLVAGVAAALVSWKTRSLLLTIIVGMAVFFVWRLLWG